MRLFVLKFGNQTFYSANFRHAMRSMTVAAFPDADQREEARKMRRFPELTRINTPGSFYQISRYTAQQAGIEHILIEEHQLDGPPLGTTLIRSTDILNSLDASYAVQVALWRYMIEGKQTDAEQIADEIEMTITDQVAGARALGQTDDQILADAREFEERMQGINVIPQIGSSKRILDHLGNQAAEVFLTITDELHQI